MIALWCVWLFACWVCVCGTAVCIFLAFEQSWIFLIFEPLLFLLFIALISEINNELER